MYDLDSPNECLVLKTGIRRRVYNSQIRVNFSVNILQDKVSPFVPEFLLLIIFFFFGSSVNTG